MNAKPPAADRGQPDVTGVDDTLFERGFSIGVATDTAFTVVTFLADQT